MTSLYLKSDDVFDKAKDFTSREEPFTLIVEGNKCKWVKRLRPFLEYIYGPGKGKFYPKSGGMSQKIKGLQFLFYGFFSGSVGVIFFWAYKAKMKSKWEETDNSIIITFESNKECKPSN